MTEIANAETQSRRERQKEKGFSPRLRASALRENYDFTEHDFYGLERHHGQ